MILPIFELKVPPVKAGKGRFLTYSEHTTYMYIVSLFFFLIFFYFDVLIVIVLWKVIDQHHIIDLYFDFDGLIPAMNQCTKIHTYN